MCRIPNGNSNTTNNTATVNVDIQILASLSLSMTTNKASPQEGDSLFFRIQVSENDEVTVPNVQVQDLLPAGLTYIEHNATLGTYTPGTGLWDIGSFPAVSTQTLGKQ